MRLPRESESVKKIASATDPLWYKDADHLRAACARVRRSQQRRHRRLSRTDSQKLDYLQDLGVTCIWLLPFFPSPLRDDGYDISELHRRQSDLRDAERFQGVSRCGSSARHAGDDRAGDQSHLATSIHGFKRRARLQRGSPQRNMYVWSDTDQKYQRRAHHLHRHGEIELDLGSEAGQGLLLAPLLLAPAGSEFRQSAVLEEVLKAMRFWLDMGVDALRLDAIPYLCERDGTICENLPETHAVIKKLRAAIDADYANRLLLAEANQWPADVRPYFGDGDECHMAFHFPLMPRIYMALRQEDRLPITDIMAQTPPIPDNCQWALVPAQP